MGSAIAKYDHVVQCLRGLKQIYRNAEMSGTVLSPHTDNFTHSGLYLRSRYLQKLSEATILLQGSTVESCGGLVPLMTTCQQLLLSNRMLKSCFHTGVGVLVQTRVDPPGLFLLVLEHHYKDIVPGFKIHVYILSF